MERWLQRLMVATPSIGSSRGFTHELFPPAVLLWWCGWSFGKESYRLTQIQMGHGCFDVLLHRIYRVSSPLCTFCGVPRRDMESSKDSVAHTLVECAVFDGKRAALVRQIGAFVLGDLVSRIMKLLSAWAAVAKFAEKVMSHKEQAGRTRDQRGGALSILTFRVK